MMAKTYITNTAQCDECEGTGVYRDPSYAEGVGTVCGPCKGSGKITTLYVAFSERRTREDVTSVQSADGSDSVSYEEFLRGNLPQE